MTLAAGTTLSDGTVIRGVDGLRFGVPVYVGQHPQHGAVDVIVLPPDVAALLVSSSDELNDLRAVQNPSIQRFFGWGQHGDDWFLCFEHIRGYTVSQVLARRTGRGESLTFREAYNVLGHVSLAIAALHESTVHGMLSTEDVFLGDGGRIRIGGAGLGRLFLRARGGDVEPFADMASIAPEVRDDPWTTSDACDFWAVGVLAVALLDGHPPTPDGLDDAIERACAPWPREVRAFIDACVARETIMRVATLDEMRALLVGALRAVRDAGSSGEDCAPAPGPRVAPAPTQISAAITGPDPRAPVERTARSEAPTPQSSPVVPTPSAPAPATPAPAPAAPAPAPPPAVPEVAASRAPGMAPPRPATPIAAPPTIDDLFAGIELPPVPGAADSAQPTRWIVRRDGRDYGPFTEQRVRDMLEADEIDEHTEVLDTNSQDVLRLVDHPTFSDFTLDYIPRRAKRRIAEQERREHVVKEVKRTGRTAVLAGIAAVVALAGIFAWTRGQVAPLPFDDFVRTWSWQVEAPEPEYRSISAGDELLAALFDFSEPLPEPEPVATASSHRGDRHGGGAGDDDTSDWAPDRDEFVLDLDNNAPSSLLTTDQINQTVYGNLHRIRPCFESETRANPNFRGATASWSIQPDGRVFNVSLSGGRVSSDFELCMERGLRSMRFPEFNNIPMSVSFPFNMR